MDILKEAVYAAIAVIGFCIFVWNLYFYGIGKNRRLLCAIGVFTIGVAFALMKMWYVTLATGFFIIAFWLLEVLSHER